MVKLASAHDKFVSKNLERHDVVRDIIENSLPVDIKNHLDIKNLKMVKDTFIDKKLKKYFSDKLFKINYKTGGWGYLYFLVEHKSHPDLFTAFQTLKYMIQIWDNVINENRIQIKIADRKAKKTKAAHKTKATHKTKAVHKIQPLKTLPLIMPLVLYHGAEEWNIPLNFSFLIDKNRPPGTDKFIPHYEYHLFDLSNFNDEDFTGTIHFQVMMLLLKNIFSNDINKKLTDIFKKLNGLDNKNELREFIETILEYITKGTDKFTDKDIENALKNAIPEIEGDKMMKTLADKWFLEGEQKGREEGEKEGEKNGILKTAIKMIKAGLKSSVIQEVTGLSQQKIQQLATQ